MGTPLLLKDDVKRFSMGPGRCAWDGQPRRRLYDYRGSAMLDYRLNRPTHGFCNKACFCAYWGD